MEEMPSSPKIIGYNLASHVQSTIKQVLEQTSLLRTPEDAALPADKNSTGQKDQYSVKNLDSEDFHLRLDK